MITLHTSSFIRRVQITSKIPISTPALHKRALEREIIGSCGKKLSKINLREIRAASVYVSLFWLLCKQLAFPCCNCWVGLSCESRAETESVEIVISGDHEREVIGICGYTIIAVIICRPCFFVFAQRSHTIIWQDHRLREEELLCNAEGEHRVAGFKSRDRMLGVSKSKDEYLFLKVRRQILTGNQRWEWARMKRRAVFHVNPMKEQPVNIQYLTLVCESVRPIHSQREPDITWVYLLFELY